MLNLHKSQKKLTLVNLKIFDTEDCLKRIKTNNQQGYFAARAALPRNGWAPLDGCHLIAGHSLHLPASL
jgi:hypothetical protein